MMKLRISLGNYPHTKPLKDGRIEIEGVEPEFVEGPSILPAARSMCRNLDLDVAEMPLTTYFVARDVGLPLRALPAFPVRVIPHFVMYAHRDITDLTQLRGAAVGVRAYTVTTGVWARGVLSLQCGVETADIDWVAADDDHVLQFVPPSNVEVRSGLDLGTALNDGNLAAVFGVVLDAGKLPNVRPFFADPAAEVTSWIDRGLPYPINHAVAIRSELLDEHPEVAPAVYRALESSRKVASTEAGWSPSASSGGRAGEFTAGMEQRFPLEYGLERNRAALDFLIAQARSQLILKNPATIDNLFIPI